MVSDLKSLRQIIVEKGVDYQDEEIDTEHLVGLVDGEARVVHAVLDRTAIVYPLNDDTNRSVRRLEAVMVWPRDIVWRKRSAVFSIGNGLHQWDSSRIHARAKRNEERN